ncbi:MAG: hypothetical protein KDD89_03480 [Anaerolineales bacterium]|nr:hypothetical protein [Anaerolineales bacterium]
MTILYLDQTDDQPDAEQLVRQAILAEIGRLALSLEAAQKRLAQFEARYGVTTAVFLADFVAEDLEGGDDEYIQWAGEAELYQRLEQKLSQLKGIEYGDFSLFRHASSHT